MSILTALMMDSATVALILVFASFSLLFFFLKPSRWRTYKFPPGPKPWPIIGNLDILNLRKPHVTMEELSEQYGDVFTFHMGMRKFVVLTGYDAVKEALVTQADDFGERGLTMPINPDFKEEGLTFGNGELSKAMRRFTLSTLRDFGMGRSTIEDHIVEEGQKLSEVFIEHQGKPFNPRVNINSAASNIICHLVFGHRFEYDDARFLVLQSRVSQIVHLATSPLIQTFVAYPTLGALLSRFNMIKKNLEENRSYFRGVCREHKARLDRNDLRCFLDSFLVRQKKEESKNPNTYFHEGNMAATATSLFAAGTETTSTTLRWGLLLMMKDPHIQEKVQAEIDSVIGRERLPRIEDRKNMPYCDAVIHEIQRFGNVVPTNLLHETKGDTNFRGYHIPKGTPVIPLLSSVLYDKRHWETPEQFNPGHFLDAEGRFIKRDAFLPFSAGRRACVGETLAKMELFLFFTILLQRFRFQPPPGVRPEDLDLTASPGLTSGPLPYQLCAISR